MKKATREFLKVRRGASHVVVRRIEYAGTSPNSCYQNACLLADTNADDLIVVCGWLIGDFLGKSGTSIIPHYWVLNEKTLEYFDPTPRPKNDFQKYEYVDDFDIMKFGSTKSILPPPLRLLEDGRFQVMVDVGVFKDLEIVDVQKLYDLNIDQSKWADIKQ